MAATNTPKPTSASAPKAARAARPARPRKAAAKAPKAPATTTTSSRTAAPEAAPPARRPRRKRPVLTPVTERLGVLGWSELDPVLLGALALEAPVLLIGEHGTAKTLVVERFATALGLDLRHYNASLLNYDDLVGIPVPDDAGGLQYLGTAGAVWDAEFVFLDEINRCRPDLQNKLFPIVHERRIAGENLSALRHRWAAINPPSAPDAGRIEYLGVEELDDALLDRFWFVVPVPAWSGLSAAVRRRLVRQGAAMCEPSPDEVSLESLVAATAAQLPMLEEVVGDRIAEHLVVLIEELGKSSVRVSPRRARVLFEVVLAVHAARLVLGDAEADLGASAEIALLHALPGRATSEPPALGTIVAAHRQAWETTELAVDDNWRVLLSETDPVQRVRIALDTGVEDRALARLVTQALSAQPSMPDRHGLAFVLSRVLAGRDLTPAAWVPIADYSRAIGTPRMEREELTVERQTELNSLIIRTYEATDAGTDVGRLTRAFARGCAVADFADFEHFKVSLARFLSTCELFGVSQ